MKLRKKTWSVEIGGGAVVLSLLALVLMAAFGCSEKPEEIRAEIEQLNTRRTDLELAVEREEKNLAKYAAQVDGLRKRTKSLSDEVALLEAKKDGRKITYYIRVELRQKHSAFSKDYFEKAIKDAMNKVQFEIPVDEDFYHKLRVGDKLLDKFRDGSAFIEGSYGSWLITVKEKHTRVSPR
jgi:hypothetical protein